MITTVHMTTSAMAAILNGKVTGFMSRKKQVCDSCNIANDDYVRGMCGIIDDGSGRFVYFTNEQNPKQWQWIPKTNNGEDLLICVWNFSQDLQKIDCSLLITCPKCIEQMKKLGY